MRFSISCSQSPRRSRAAFVRCLAVFFVGLFAFAATAMAHSDTRISFKGHVPRTWDDGNPPTDDHIDLQGRLSGRPVRAPFRR